MDGENNLNDFNFLGTSSGQDYDLDQVANMHAILAEVYRNLSSNQPAHQSPNRGSTSSNNKESSSSSQRLDISNSNSIFVVGRANSLF